MSDLPILLHADAIKSFPAIVEEESFLLTRAGKLFNDDYYDHALLDIWNAAVNNLRRKVEAYGIDIFISTVKDESGRKRFAKDGDSLSERWSGVDELVLIAGATRLGLLNKKASKALEMINWMRNHASPAHRTDSSVEKEDVVALALLLQKNLFEDNLPEAGHSAASLFEPIKAAKLTEGGMDTLKDQIDGLRTPDVRVAFGFMLDLLCGGLQPAYGNIQKLFPPLWSRAPNELKKTVGLRYHSFTINPDSDESTDKKAHHRILYFLTEVNGIEFIPNGARSAIYRRAVEKLKKAKNTSYGWNEEEVAAKTLAQFGPHVPSIAFEEIYQEILAVWCGNYWGRSEAYVILNQFVDALNVDQIRFIAQMFINNDRLQSELFQSKPKTQAIGLLNYLKDKLVLEPHKSEIDNALGVVNTL